MDWAWVRKESVDMKRTAMLNLKRMKRLVGWCLECLSARLYVGGGESVRRPIWGTSGRRTECGVGSQLRDSEAVILRRQGRRKKITKAKKNVKEKIKEERRNERK